MRKSRFSRNAFFVMALHIVKHKVGQVYNNNMLLLTCLFIQKKKVYTMCAKQQNNAK